MICTFAYAQNTGGASTEEVQTGSLTETSAGQDTAEGGNVTMMNLSSTQSTTRWQGYYGNVSGTLALGYNSNIFFDFASASVSSVFASQNQTFDFASLAAGNAADVDSLWGYASGADTAQTIFTGTTSIQGVSAPSVELQPALSNFNSTILNDGTNGNKQNFAFGVNVQQPGVSCFDGTDCEYELMVPSDGQEVYYFFLTI